MIHKNFNKIIFCVFLFPFRQEYVDLYVDFMLNKSIAKHFDAFNRGFHKVCGGRVLRLFQSHELMDLVVGQFSISIQSRSPLTDILFFFLQGMKTMTGMHCKETPSTKTASVLTTLLFVYFGKSFTRCLSSKRKISSSFLPAQIVYPSWE